VGSLKHTQHGCQEPSQKLHQIKARVRLDQVVLLSAHTEWSSVTGPGPWS